MQGFKMKFRALISFYMVVAASATSPTIEPTSSPTEISSGQGPTMIQPIASPTTYPNTPRPSTAKPTTNMPTSSECPMIEPLDGESCETIQIGIQCPYYEYRPRSYDGTCTFQDGFRCSYTTRYECSENLKWEWRLRSSPMYCSDPEPGSPYGMACTPCPIVEPEGICPSTQPKSGESCDVEEGTVCKYDFLVQGCRSDELQCKPGSFYECEEGIWIVSYADPIYCPPYPYKPCPDTKPENGSCVEEGYELHQSCGYEYRNTSCDEGQIKCSPMEIYTCGEPGWSFAMPYPTCPNNNFPSGFLDFCDPNDVSKPCPDIEPEDNPHCVEDGYDVGLVCGYDHINIGCDEGEEQCGPTTLYMCDEFGWSVFMPLFTCPDNEYPPDFGLECNPNGGGKQCPDTKPERHASCTEEGHDVGLKCNYHFIDISCVEGEEKCTPTEIYTCGESGWSVAMPGFMCPDNGYPASFGSECNPRKLVTKVNNTKDSDVSEGIEVEDAKGSEVSGGIEVEDASGSKVSEGIEVEYTSGSEDSDVGEDEGVTGSGVRVEVVVVGVLIFVVCAVHFIVAYCKKNGGTSDNKETTDRTAK